MLFICKRIVSQGAVHRFLKWRWANFVASVYVCELHYGQFFADPQYSKMLLVLSLILFLN